ncbi:MAG: hypothetical protein WCR51_02100 [Planctomycetia bacterium]
MISLALLGCGKPVPNGMVRVHGSISYEGKRLPDGTINFEAADGKGSATARIQADGSFAAVMPPGAYRAMICSQDGVITFDKNFKPIEPPSRIPKRYENLETSGLEFKVPTNDGQLTINLE